MAYRPNPTNTVWSFASRAGRFERTTRLALYWEARLDPISDEFSPDAMDAVPLLRKWSDSLNRSQSFDPSLGPGWVPIFWSIDGDGIAEFAPFDPMNPTEQDFLTHFTCPTDPSGTPVNWLRLPVVDKLWNRRSSEKGGFIQEATGWKPGPYQSHLHLPTILRAAGL